MRMSNEELINRGRLLDAEIRVNTCPVIFLLVHEI